MTYAKQQYNMPINFDFIKSEKPCASNWDSCTGRLMMKRQEHGALE